MLRKQVALLAMVISLFLTGCYEVSGKIVQDGGTPLAGVVVSISGEQTYQTQTNAEGEYVIEKLMPGPYIITPSLQNYTFEPQSLSVNLAGDSVYDFTGYYSSPDIQMGTVTDFQNPVALIITSERLSPLYQCFALLHSLTGIPTQIKTIEDICAESSGGASSATDQPSLIKEYIKSIPGLRYVVLGGDIDAVPTVSIENSYSWEFYYLGMQLGDINYASTHQVIMTDYFYADLDDWDKNDDGLYLVEGEDDGTDLRAELAVSRIPFSDIMDIYFYFEKVLSHLTNYNKDHIKKFLLHSGIYASYSILGQTYDLQRSWYYYTKGRTLDIIHENSDFQVLEQYAKASHSANPDADVYTAQAHYDAFADGQNIVYHGTHASPETLISGTSSERIGYAQIANFYNSTFPIVLSGGCNCASLTHSGGGNVAEAMVAKPDGGAIVFFGNTGYGSGLNGRMQYMDELIRAMLDTPCPILGDALLKSTNAMPQEDSFVFPFNELSPLLPNWKYKVVDAETYAYTQTSNIALGDVLIPVWNRPVDVLSDVRITRTALDAQNDRLRIVPGTHIKHTPVVYAGGVYYGFENIGPEYQVDIPRGEAALVGIAPSSTHQALFKEIAPL